MGSSFLIRDRKNFVADDFLTDLDNKMFRNLSTNNDDPNIMCSSFIDIFLKTLYVHVTLRKKKQKKKTEKNNS